MGLAHSPSIVTNELVFYYDMNNLQKSWKGAPMTNLVNPNWASWSIDGSGQGSIGTRTITDSFTCTIVDEVANTRQNASIDSGITASTTYTFSVQYKKLFGTPTLRFQIQAYNGGTYLSTMSFATTAQLGLADIEGWQTAKITLTTPASTNRIVWFMQDGDDYTTYTHRFMLANVQCEQQAFATPFVAGTRYANSNLESSPSYPSWNTLSGSSYSGGTLTFTAGSYNSKSGWDLYKTYSGLSTGTNYTWSALVRLGTASNLIITMNNTQAWNTGPSTVVAGLSSTDWTRITITGTTDTGSFNLHLGASFNTEVASTVQSAGTVFIQDVRLVLSQSQTAIADMMDKNTITASSLTYESDGTFSFNGNNNNFIDGGNNTGALNITQPTICVWVRRTSYNSSLPMIIRRNDRDAYSLQVGQSNDTIWFKIYHGSSSWTSTPTSTIPLNTWCHFCGVFNGSQVLLYKNGQLVQSASTTSPISYGESTIPQLIIGRDDAVSGRYWHGSIPNVQIYNRPLSAAEIQQNFNAQRGIYGI
jgi:hypothetical protein